MNGYILTLSQEIRFGGILQEDNRAGGTRGAGRHPPDFGRIRTEPAPLKDLVLLIASPLRFSDLLPPIYPLPLSIFRPSASSDGPIKNEFSRRACLVVL
jgi:hypothetical protein